MNELRVGVIGAGTMGTGLAERFAGHGLTVTLIDTDPEQLDSARRNVETFERTSSLLGLAYTPSSNVSELVTYSDQVADLRGVDYVIENVTEDFSVKRDVYSAIDDVCGSQMVLAANTSCIPITRLAGVRSCPENTIGIHFMNPVPKKDTAELIRGRQTGERAVEQTLGLLKRTGIRPIEVNDSAGFVTNRVLMMTINEAAFLVHEGVAQPEQIDDIFRSCFGHASGPLETADLIGIDVILASIDELYKEYGDPKYRACPLLRMMMDSGDTGRKKGAGFYQY